MCGRVLLQQAEELAGALESVHKKQQLIQMLRKVVHPFALLNSQRLAHLLGVLKGRCYGGIAIVALVGAWLVKTGYLPVPQEDA